MQRLKAREEEHYTLKKRTGDESACRIRKSTGGTLSPTSSLYIPSGLRQGEGDEVYAKDEGERRGKMYGA